MLADNKVIAWYGTEMEGVYKGLQTLFIRGGYEGRLAEAFEVCMQNKMYLEQVYFGAGSTRPNMLAVIALARHLSVITTVEIGPDQVNEIPLDGKLIVIVTVVVPTIGNVFLKKRNDVELAVGIVYELAKIDDVNGMYEEDVPLLWEKSDDEHAVVLSN